MKNVFFRIGLIALIFTSCGISEQEKQQIETIQKQTKQIMAIHDEVMPKMDELHSLIKQMDLMMVSLNEDTSAIASQSRKEIESIIDVLNQADKEMMEWMRNWKFPKDNAPSDETLAYLRDQKTSVNRMALNMKDALTKAHTYIGEYKLND